MDKNYIISPVSFYCEDEELWYTKVGIDSGNMPLLYTVWGQTEAESRTRSEKLLELLKK